MQASCQAAPEVCIVARLHRYLLIASPTYQANNCAYFLTQNLLCLEPHDVFVALHQVGSDSSVYQRLVSASTQHTAIPERRVLTRSMYTTFVITGGAVEALSLFGPPGLC